MSETDTTSIQPTDETLSAVEARLLDDDDKIEALARVEFSDVRRTFPSTYFDAQFEFWHRGRADLIKQGKWLGDETWKSLLQQMWKVVFVSLAADTRIVAGASVTSDRKLRERWMLVIDVMVEALKPRQLGGKQWTPTATADKLSEIVRARLDGLSDPLEHDKPDDERGYGLWARRAAGWGPS